MSRAAFAVETDAGKSSSARMSGGVRVSKPGDSHEVEADHVADTVVRGGQVPGWSLAARGFDGIQRKAESHSDAVAQVEQALLSSAEGRAAIAKVTAGAASGITVTGPAAGGVVAALATGRKASASGASIALDGIHPGLHAKVTREGGPGGAAVALNYAPKSPEQHAAPETKAGPKLVEKPVAKETPHPVQDHKPAAAPKHEAAHQAGKKEELTVHRKAERAEPIHTGSAEVDSVVRSPGREIEPATRREMESRIGFDFGSVRLHTDARAGESAQGLSAQAYTVGSDVVFAPGRYSPQTSEGRHLLAHELTHVVQQTSGTERGGATGLHVAKPAPRVVQRAWSGRDLPGVGWLLDKIHDLPGYDLFSFVIGKDLIEDKDVDRNALTLTEAVLQLLGPIGKAILEKLKKVGKALEAAYQWLVARIRELGLNGDYFSNLLDRAWDAVSGWHPIRSWERIKEIMREPLDKLITLAGEIIDKVEEIIIEAAISAFGETGRKIWAFFKKAGAVIGKIAAHPLQFAENLFKAVQEGFTSFGKNILKHLGDGLKIWIFDELHIKGVTMPADFTFGSMLKLVLQVLGLTYEQRRPQLVEKLGEPAVYFFETSAKVLTRVQKEGFSAIKEMILEKANSIYDSLVASLRDWVAKEIVERGIEMVAKLASPVGEFIQAVQSIYETIEFIIDKASQLKDLIDSVLDALSDIANGVIGPAAQKIEDSLANAIPLLLRFIAGQFHLTGIGKSIREIIDKIRAPIDNVIGKVLDFIVEKAKPLWEEGKAAFSAKLDAIKDWWAKPAKFNYGDEEHELGVEEENGKPEVYVHSDRSRLKVFLADHNASAAVTREALLLAKGLSWKEGKVESLSKKEAGYNNFVKLTKLMDNLKSKYPKKSEVNDRKEVHSEFGSAVSADAFLSKDLLTGSDPGGTDPVAWTDLGYLLPPNPPYFVRGHLISEKLGGRGEWTNLMPITNKANGEMERTVEGPLKDALANPKNGNFYYYSVKANYAKPRVPSEQNATTTKLQHDRADQAVKRLVSLSWTVTEAVNDSGDWKATRRAPKGPDGKEMPKDVQRGKVNAREE
jgi:Domain of unknown function (DUF4157)